MNTLSKLSLGVVGSQTITLRDLVKPQLNKREQAAIRRALKNAKKDQDETRKKASLV
ncbi:MAG TPA: hypothetical protein PKC86_02050 [Candidatus Saccharibacteria bacterium]|nr:hypothetical protein [Candidatus Saccharibacteria bacterium]